MANLAHVARPTVPQKLADARQAASRYMAGSRADTTKRAYRSDWRAFETWCTGNGLDALPASPETVASYLADAADTLKPSTLTRRCASISVAHQAAGHESPTQDARVRATLSGIRRSKSTAQAQKTPAVTA